MNHGGGQKIQLRLRRPDDENSFYEVGVGAIFVVVFSSFCFTSLLVGDGM
jgi:hypothetical protein